MSQQENVCMRYMPNVAYEITNNAPLFKAQRFLRCWSPRPALESPVQWRNGLSLILNATVHRNEAAISLPSVLNIMVLINIY
jgi:hypothetical protein